MISATKLLNSPDPTVHQVALNQLSESVSKQNNIKTCTPDDLDNLLNSDPKPGEGKQGDLRNLWSLCRTSLRQTTTKLYPPFEGNQAWLEVADTTCITDTKKAVPFIKNQSKVKFLEQMCTAPDQGRTFAACSKDPASNHWIKSGHFISFAAYRFAIKGRLNLLPVKTTQRRMGQSQTDTLCRKCGDQPETLAHVINHCPPYVGLMRSRHGNILKRLVKALPKDLGDIYMEQKLPEDSRGLKPDLVVRNERSKTIHIVDVAIPFDTEANMTEARKQKVAKYEYLQPLLLSKGYKTVTVQAFTVSSLGSWDPENEETLKTLKVNRSYARLFRKLCCINTIEDSQAIWRARCRR